jgi:chromosome segregation ATPase
VGLQALIQRAKLLFKLDALREVHAHNEEKRNAFRRQHTDVYAEFEKVQAELDALSTELSSFTQKEVALDANFSRYGYSAHTREWNMGI